MKVMNLIEHLLRCDPSAEVLIEAYDGNEANEIKNFGSYVYIADSFRGFENLPEESTDSKVSYALDFFLEEEVPYRLRELGVSDTDAEKVKETILDKICIGRGGSFAFIDYDAFDRFIAEILKAENVKFGGD